MPLPYYATPDTHTIAASHLLRADELTTPDTIYIAGVWEVVTGTMSAHKDGHTVILFGDDGGFATVPHGTLYHVSDVVELHQYIATIDHPFYPDGLTIEVVAPYSRRAESLVMGAVKGVDETNWRSTVGGLSIGDKHYTVPNTSR